LVSEHYADDLEVDLEAAMLQDFNTELRDDSPRQVMPSPVDGVISCAAYHSHSSPSSICITPMCFHGSQVSLTLVSLHQDCLQGNFSRIQQLKDHMNTNAHNLAQSQQEVVSLLLIACMLLGEHVAGFVSICL